MTGLERLASLTGSLDEQERSDAAHALRTPLAVIRGYAELLSARRDPETQERAVRAIDSAVDQLQGAVDALFPHSGGEHTAPGLRSVEGAGHATVLVVDDDERVRALLRLTLPDDTYTVVEAADGVDALELMPLVEPDLVVLDWNLPTGSGAAVLTSLSRDFPHTPVLVLTADHQESARTQALTRGAAGFLTKPFSPLELLSSFERLISAETASPPVAQSAGSPAVVALRPAGPGPATA